MRDSTQYVKPTWLLANQLRSYVFDIILICCAIIALAVSFFVLQPSDPDSNWFMRSGSIVVLMGAVMEFRHNGFQHSIDMTSVRWASGVGGPVIFQPSFFRSLLGYIAHIFVICGTFIAAYGDLILVRFLS